MDLNPTVEVQLSRGLVALIDQADLPLVACRRWRALQGMKGPVYAASGHSNSVQPLVLMHRLIARTPDGMVTDHINGDSLDNRRANLRIATSSQNRANSAGNHRGAGKTSRFKGVAWDAASGRWHAKIHGRSLGRYVLEEDAASAYDVAALAAWGEFAYLNFPAVAA